MAAVLDRATGYTFAPDLPTVTPTTDPAIHVGLVQWADADVTEAQCASVGGRYMQTTGWMVHAWVVPSWESPDGVLSHENPNLRCADDTFNTDSVGKCQGT